MVFVTQIREMTYGLILVSIMACGCVAPTHHSLAHVEDGVLARTGHDLGSQAVIDEFGMQGWVNFDDGLSEEEAIAVGLWNNPRYRELLADLGITRADVLEAAQVRNPQVTTMIPLSAKQWEFAVLVPLDVLWLRPVRVAAAELESHRVAERLVQDGLNVVRDIRVAYIDWKLATRLSELAHQSADLRNEVARIANARLSAGDLAELDVAAIRLDAAIGVGESERAARQAGLAREQLRYTLGIQFTDYVLVPDSQFASIVGDYTVDDLVAEALASRPDLSATRLAINAAEYRAALASRDIWQLSAWLPDYNGQGDKGAEAGPGLQFTLPLFHRNGGAVARANAEAERLQRQLENQRGMATLEVRQARLQYLLARNDLANWREEILPQARDAAESSQKALAEGNISLLLVLETNRQLITAEQREQESNAQLERALAELERSVGRRLADIEPIDSTSPDALQPAPEPTPLDRAETPTRT